MALSEMPPCLAQDQSGSGGGVNVVTAPRFISLFSGVGGLDLGLKLALPEAQCCGYVEWEGTAAIRLAARIEEGSLDAAAIWSDVRTFPSGRYRGIPSLGVTGGFPCVDLSLAGKRLGINAGARSGLWWEYLRIIRESGAEWAFIENVPGLLCSPGIDDVESGEPADGEPADWPFRNIDAVLGPLSELGFDAEWCTISAADVGASHGRRRVFILAYRTGSRRGRDAGQHDGRPPSLPARSNECDGRVEDSGRRGAGRLQQEPEPRCSEPANVSDAGRAMVDTSWDGQHGREREDGRGGRWGVCEPGEQLGHSTCDDRAVLQSTGREYDAHGPGASGGLAAARLGIFAPGPTNPIWQDVLVQRSWVRPSLSQAEVEPAVCNLPHGLADLVAHERTAALRGAGNGVVSLQAAVAFTILARRAGLFGF